MCRRSLSVMLACSMLAVAPLTLRANEPTPGTASIRAIGFQEPDEPKQPEPEKPAAPKPAAQKPQDTESKTDKPAEPDKTPAKEKPAPPATRPAPAVTPRSPTSPFAGLQMPTGRRSFLRRMTRAPSLFGDNPNVSVGQISSSSSSSSDPVINIPGAGATRRFKNEQSRALPTDRVFFFFNHFHNALEISGFGGSVSEDVNQFTFGAEQTFGNGDWSVEVRLPIATETDFGNDFNRAQSDGLGNLTVTLKKLLYADDDYALALGLATSAPTGDNADVDFFGTQVTIENEAVHLLPYLALQATPDDNWFFHAFAQIDVAANGDGIRVDDGGGVSTARLVEQTFLFLDAAAGYWWIRSDTPDASGLTGLASVIELHYTTTLNDAHTPSVGFLNVGNIDNRIDVVNLTTGLHSEWNGDTAIRLAAVVPLRDARENRFFDFEFQFAIIKRM